MFINIKKLLHIFNPQYEIFALNINILWLFSTRMSQTKDVSRLFYFFHSELIFFPLTLFTHKQQKM